MKGLMFSWLKCLIWKAVEFKSSRNVMSNPQKWDRGNEQNHPKPWQAAVSCQTFKEPFSP